MIFSSTIELTCVVLESVNLVSNVGFCGGTGANSSSLDVFGRFSHFSTFWGEYCGPQRLFSFRNIYFLYVWLYFNYFIPAVGPVKAKHPQ